MDRKFYYSDIDADWVRVALRKESVDRKGEPGGNGLRCAGSLSARRAWIEKTKGSYRNGKKSSRSPQGERG